MNPGTDSSAVVDRITKSLMPVDWIQVLSVEDITYKTARDYLAQRRIRRRE